MASIEKLTHQSVLDASSEVDFSPRILEIAEYLSDGDENTAVILSLGMCIMLEPIEDGRIVPEGDDFEDWLAKKGLEVAIGAIQNPTSPIIESEFFNHD